MNDPSVLRIVRGKGFEVEVLSSLTQQFGGISFTCSMILRVSKMTREKRL